MSRPIAVCLLASLWLGAGCAVRTAPRVQVLGVSETQAADARRTLLVFVEVENPTGRAIQLDKLEYHLEAAPWFETRGQVTLTRQVPADSSAIVEIPVAVSRAEALGGASIAGGSAGVPFRLVGKLFDRTERSWSVTAEGSFARAAGGTARGRVVVAPR